MPHTPGPWEASQWRVCAGLGEGQRISVVCDTANNKASRTAENAANAKLIAAAPDLLAFAQAHEAWEAEFIMANDCWPMTSEMLPRFNETILEKFLQLQKVRNEAVAKATK